MIKKISFITVISLILFTTNVHASNVSWDNPNVDWKIVDKTPQKFKGWKISTKRANICRTLDPKVCSIVKVAKGGDNISVLGQSKIKGDFNNYKVKTSDGEIGWIYESEVYLPLENPKKYKITPNNSLIRPLKTSGLSNLKLTATFNEQKKQKELIDFAKKTNLSYYDDGLHLIDENYTIHLFQDELAVIDVRLFSSNTWGITLYNTWADTEKEMNRVDKQGKVYIEYLLKPYFPKSYKKLADVYVKQDYKTAKKLWKNGDYYKVDGRWVNFGFSLFFKPKK